MSDILKFKRSEELKFDIEQLGANFTFNEQYSEIMGMFLSYSSQYEFLELEEYPIIIFPEGTPYNPRYPLGYINKVYELKEYAPPIKIDIEESNKIIDWSKVESIDRTRNVAKKIHDYTEKLKIYDKDSSQYSAQGRIPEMALREMMRVNFLYSFEKVDETTIILGIHKLNGRTTKRYLLKNIDKYNDVLNTKIDDGLLNKIEEFDTTYFNGDNIENANHIEIKDTHILGVLKEFKFIDIAITEISNYL